MPKNRPGNKTDPFQYFEVEHEPCQFLKITVLRGRNISKGTIGDIFDKPDAYVVIHIPDAPDGRKQTKHINNNTNPEWNEEFTYLLPPVSKDALNAEIKLMDANYVIDQQLGSVEFDIRQLPTETRKLETFTINEKSEIDIEFTMTYKYDSDMRYSLALCPEEKIFRSARKRLVLNAMRRVMVGGPRNLRETPIVAVIGSGGGFRAVTGYSGAIKALHDMGIFDCATYVCGVSGSCWYLAALYAHDRFPTQGPEVVNKEIRENIQSSPFWLLRPECLMRYCHQLRAKMKLGQPVTFTDFFGLLIGQTLLGSQKMETGKLSNFREKIENDKLPMPLLTCLHVRPCTSALTFHDWIEFSPYEVGMAKYGAFMNTKLFGSKFFMGFVAKEFEESPLHFLMGIWGSAFSILFYRLVKNNCMEDETESRSEDFRQELETELDHTIKNEESVGANDDSDVDLSDADEDDSAQTAQDEPEQSRRRSSLITNLFGSDNTQTNDETNSNGFFETLASKILGSHFMKCRKNRAGKILNYMRGLSLSRTYPLSPFSPNTNSSVEEDKLFEKIHEAIEVKRKKVHLVDAGLTFNSPYPAILRPQRSVDLIISFEFSSREKDSDEPFEELLLAEKWARFHDLPFPKIDRSVFAEQGMKECYVFRDESDDRAPIIIHFVLCNEQFRNYSAPGVPREPGDKRGEFSIFDSPKTPYSSFNFQYSNDEFDRLHNLMEFNTLLHKNTILEEIRNCISLRRYSRSKGSITLNDIRNSMHLSKKNKLTLEKTIMTMGEIPLD